MIKPFTSFNADGRGKNRINAEQKAKRELFEFIQNRIYPRKSIKIRVHPR